MTSSNSKEMNHYKFKVVVLGDQSVGKTSFVLRYTKGEFHRDLRSTILMDVVTKPVILGDTEVALSLHDCSGQDRFMSVLPVRIFFCLCQLQVTYFKSYYR